MDIEISSDEANLIASALAAKIENLIKADDPAWVSGLDCTLAECDESSAIKQFSGARHNADLYLRLQAALLKVRPYSLYGSFATLSAARDDRAALEGLC